MGVDKRCGETLQGQRYAVGQQFKPHHDFFHTEQSYWQKEKPRGGQRSWTGMIYLNEPERGGETNFPNAARDPQGKLRVGAAVGVGEGTEERVELLVKAGVDALVVDTAHGHSHGVIERVRWVKKNFPQVDVDRKSTRLNSSHT